MKGSRDLTEVEVLVVGGGTAGVLAAIASARSGADTLLIERYGLLGGAAIHGLPLYGLVSWDGEPIATQLTMETVGRLQEAEGTAGLAVEGSWGEGAPSDADFSVLPYDPEVLNLVLFRLCQESGVRMLLHSFASDVLMDGVRVSGVRYWSKSGYRDIRARVVVDASGNALVAERAGGEMTTHGEGKQPVVGLGFRLGRADLDEFWVDAQSGRLPWDVDLQRARLARGCKIREHNTSLVVVEIPIVCSAEGQSSLLIGHSARRGEIHFFVSRAWEGESIYEAELAERENIWDTWNKLRDGMPSLARSYIASSAPQVSVWYGRSIKGQASVVFDEYMSGKAQTLGAVPVTWPLGRGVTGADTPLRFPKSGYAIPYGSFLPRGIEGLLVAGQSISAEASVLPGVSTPAACMGMGDVVGQAAAAAVRSKCLPSDLDPVRLADIFTRQNAGGTIR